MSHRIPVGGGSPEGTNSAYLLPDRRLLVDPGPPTESSWAALTDGIAEAGVAPADIDHVVVTHWHVDHAGLAPRLADAADATIHMHERDAPFVRTYEGTHRRRRERDLATMAAWGVPAERREEVAGSDTPSGLPAETPVTDHADGDTVAGTTLWHTPGHTEGHVAVATDDSLYVGDAVLQTYTPNAGGSDTRAQNPLADYAATLDRVAASDRTLRPGHGETVRPDRVETIRAHHRDRSRDLFETVAETGPITPWAVARRLFGDMAAIHVKFGAGEAAAHLQLLVGLGAVERTATDPDRYETVADEWPATAFPF